MYSKALHTHAIREQARIEAIGLMTEGSRIYRSGIALARRYELADLLPQTQRNSARS